MQPDVQSAFGKAVGRRGCDGRAREKQSPRSQIVRSRGSQGAGLQGGRDAVRLGALHRRKSFWNDTHLTSGRRGAQLPIISAYQLLDASRDGTAALLGIRHKDGGYDRLDVVSVTVDKHVAGWRPYKTEKEKKEQTVKVGGHGRCDAAS